SWSCTLTVADPFASGAGVYVNVPLAEAVGWCVKCGFLLLVWAKVSACPFSFAGPALMLVAQFPIVRAPASSSTVWSAPLVKLGEIGRASCREREESSALVAAPQKDGPKVSWSCTITVKGPLTS